MKSNIAVIGLATMGKNLVLNLLDHQYIVSVYNRTFKTTLEFINQNPNPNLKAFDNLQDLVLSLETPRKILLMIKAGEAIDHTIESLLAYLSPGDIIMDGGNSYFLDTQRRYNYLLNKEINYLGIGISGGELGARFGPAIMPGGDIQAYQTVQDIFESIAAKVNGDACCKYTAQGGAGHFVKMVHNGIEYGDMQLIAETYSLLKTRYNHQEIIQQFEQMNKSELASYLIEITAKLLKVKDPESNNYLVDMILDESAQKGTGMWTSLESIKLGIDTSIIISALNARYNSTFKQLRTLIHNKIDTKIINADIDVEDVTKALYLAKILAYTQGFALMKAAQQVYDYDYNFSSIARIFQGGCIIQAQLLQVIIPAFAANNNLESLILDQHFATVINNYQESLRKVVKAAIDFNLAIPSFSAALQYLDSFKTKDSNANIIQAQRDYFGAHTVKRIDKDYNLNFHYDWDKYE